MLVLEIFGYIIKLNEKEIKFVFELSRNFKDKSIQNTTNQLFGKIRRGRQRLIVISKILYRSVIKVIRKEQFLIEWSGCNHNVHRKCIKLLILFID